MSALRLLLDEDVRSLLAEILRSRGHDVVAVVPLGMGGTADPEDLAWAIREKRAVLTHNVRDYPTLARVYAEKGQEHYGIIVSDRVPFKTVLARTLRLLAQRQAEDLKSRLDWLQNYR